MSCRRVRLHVLQPESVHLAVGADGGMALAVGAEIYASSAYHGDYSVTPTNQAQTLPTAGHTLRGDIVVEAIPSNYGLITYNGSIITVS